MNHAHYIVIFLLLPFGLAKAESEMIFEGNNLSFSYPERYSAKKIPLRAGHLEYFAANECYKLVTDAGRKNTHVATICAHKNLNKVKMDKIGFKEYKSLPDQEKTFDKYNVKYVYASAMSMYPVEKFNISLGVGYSAKDVDCDAEGAQPIYRATGSCDIAALQLKDGSGISIDFTIKNHVRKQTLSTHDDFNYVIQSIRKSGD